MILNNHGWPHFLGLMLHKQGKTSMTFTAEDLAAYELEWAVRGCVTAHVETDPQTGAQTKVTVMLMDKEEAQKMAKQVQGR